MAKNGGVTREQSGATGGGGIASTPSGARRRGNGPSSFATRNADSATGGGGLTRTDWQTNAPASKNRLGGGSGKGQGKGVAPHVSTTAAPAGRGRNKGER